MQKGEHTTVRQWAELFLENYSKPPLRSAKTHETHQRAVKHLNRVFGDRMLTELTADAIEGHLRNRLRGRVRYKTRDGRVIEKGVIKPSTIHQEFRVFGEC